MSTLVVLEWGQDTPPDPLRQSHLTLTALTTPTLMPSVPRLLRELLLPLHLGHDGISFGKHLSSCIYRLGLDVADDVSLGCRGVN